PVQGAHHPAGRAEAEQRGAGEAGAGAGGEGQAARGAEHEHRGEEPRGRVGPRQPRGEGGAAFADLQVQERVPGEHEPRAAHAAQLAADPRQAARRQQVLKNLLANAFKFTEQGKVRLVMDTSYDRADLESETLQRAAKVLRFSVIDTGIGIPRNKQKIIFEAFQQADGTTSRKYGGTGLGLSISREITRLLGGEIEVKSEPGEGSTFTLYLPDTYFGSEPEVEDHAARARTRAAAEQLAQGGEEAWPKPAAVFLTEVAPPPPEEAVPRPIEDDREHLREGDRVILIIEDHSKFARLRVGIAREKRFK